MELHEREYYVSRIDAGYIRFRSGNTILRIYAPKKDVFYESQEVYLDTLEEAKFNGVMTREESQYLLEDCGVWTDSMQNEFEIAPKNIEELKVQLYELAHKAKEQKKVKQYLIATKETYEDLLSYKHSWDYLTAEGIASFSRWQYIIENSVYTQNNQKYKWGEMSVLDVMQYYNSQVLSEEIIRELSREEPWAGIWVIRKKNCHIFDEPMSIEQRAIILWSNMYDNIHESPECPHSSILKDDDMLDGWLILQRRKREKDQHKSWIDEKLSNNKIRNSEEVFIQVEDQNSANVVHSVNSDFGNAVRVGRLKKVSEEGQVRFSDFADVKQKIINTAGQMRKERR